MDLHEFRSRSLNLFTLRDCVSGVKWNTSRGKAWQSESLLVSVKNLLFGANSLWYRSIQVSESHDSTKSYFTLNHDLLQF